MSAPTVQLARPIILGTKGKDVVAVKRSLSRAGYLNWKTFTDICGTYMRDAYHEFQKDHNIPRAGYGQKTHQTLLNTHKEGSKTEWAWDSLSIQWEHEQYVYLHSSSEVRVRSAIIQAARNLYASRYSIQYSQSRPSPLYVLGGTIPTHLDCSGTVTTCYHAAGALNPNWYAGARMAYNGEGYTGTLIAGGTKITKEQLKLADLIFYGFTTQTSPAFPYGSPTHVALYAGDGTVFSMGHYPMGHYPINFGMPINCYVTYKVV